MSISSDRGFANRSTLLIMVAALAAGAGLYAAQEFLSPRMRAPAATGGVPAAVSARLKSVRLIQPARSLRPFDLAVSDGSRASAVTLRGHWTVVFLGFTHCPDICPTTLAELSKAQRSWRDIPAEIRPKLLFVSVDPERDTAQTLGKYAHYFDEETIAATAEPAALAQFTQSLGMVYMKIPVGNSDYSIDHSATLVLLDPEGRQAGLIRPPLDWKSIAGDLRLLAEAAR